jgi:hypothetical protein
MHRGIVADNDLFQSMGKCVAIGSSIAGSIFQVPTLLPFPRGEIAHCPPQVTATALTQWVSASYQTLSLKGLDLARLLRHNPLRLEPVSKAFLREIGYQAAGARTPCLRA